MKDSITRDGFNRYGYNPSFEPEAAKNKQAPPIQKKRASIQLKQENDDNVMLPDEGPISKFHALKGAQKAATIQKKENEESELQLKINEDTQEPIQQQEQDEKIHLNETELTQPNLDLQEMELNAPLDSHPMQLKKDDKLKMESQQKPVQLSSSGNVVQRLKDISDTDFIKKHGHKFEEEGWLPQELVADLKLTQNSKLTESQYLAQYKIKISNRKEKDPDTTYGGARQIGDSNALARNRYYMKPRKVTFKTWKKDREAQHLIPACLAKNIPSLVNIVDRVENGKMLPAKYSTTNTMPTHRQLNHRDHDKYTKNVQWLIQEVKKKNNGQLDQTILFKIMEAVRNVNKTKKYSYLDFIPQKKFKEAWNKKNKLNKSLQI